MPLELFDIDDYLDQVEDEQWRREQFRTLLEKYRHLPPKELIKILLEEV